MNLKHPSLSKIVVYHETHFDRPSLISFRKEGHALVVSKSFLDLYKRCVRMGYEIKDVSVEHKFKIGIEEYIEVKQVIEYTNRLMRRYRRGV